MSPMSLVSSTCYSGNKDTASWRGHLVDDADSFTTYLREVVAPRVHDEELGFEDNLRALATTGMATEQVERLLQAVPGPKEWEIGEALAECLLQQDDETEVHWPWNTTRDRRTPQASLPGADLVGFCRIGGIWLLLFGEVKTSSDANAPPGVMNGRSGMAWQLQENATRMDIQKSLLEWLYARCRQDPELDRMYKESVQQFLASGGKQLFIVGVLLRDTRPDERDLKGRGEFLAQQLSLPTKVRLHAWYLPVSISDWPRILEGGVS